MAKTPKKSGPWRGDALAAVLAQLDAIEQWQASKRTLKSYFETHQDALPMKYEHFVRSVARFRKEGRPTHDRTKPTVAPEAIPTRPVEPAARPDSSPARLTDPAPGSEKPESPATGKFGRFDYDPTPDPSKLI